MDHNQITKRVSAFEAANLGLVNNYKRKQIESIHPWMDLTEAGMIESIWGRASFCEGNTGPRTEDSYYNPIFISLHKANRILLSVFGKRTVRSMTYWFINDLEVTVITKEGTNENL